MKRCSVEGCNRWNDTRGLCRPHYYRFLRTGTTRAHVPIGEGSRTEATPDASWMICTNPAHQDDYDQLGACLICRVPTINGLHPSARAALLAKRPDLAHVVTVHGSDAIDPEAATPIPPTQMAAASGSPTRRLSWLNPLKQVVGHPGETS